MRYRIQPDQPIYFVTFSVVDWLPVFVTEEACQIIADSLSFCHLHKLLRVNVFVILPTHLHAVVFDDAFDPERLAQSLADLRKHTGLELIRYCERAMPRCFLQCLACASTGDRQHRFWQKGMHPQALYSQEVWRQKVEYLHENPCRKGLVGDPRHWRFSSAGSWLDGSGSEVMLTPLEW